LIIDKELSFENARINIFKKKSIYSSENFISIVNYKFLSLTHDKIPIYKIIKQSINMPRNNRVCYKNVYQNTIKFGKDIAKIRTHNQS
jgi:hypothetical protein